MIIPKSLQATYVQILHEGHPGLDATKQQARDTVYWISTCKDIEQYVTACAATPCPPSHGNLLASIYSTGMAEIIWPSAILSPDGLTSHRSTTLPSSVITILKRQFSTHGIPATVITNNARQFDCHEFQQFSQTWNFHHITSSPLYPQSNGLAESSVKRAKLVLEKTQREGSDIYRDLLNIRNVPADHKLGSPSQRLMSPRLRTTVPTTDSLLKPTIQTQVSVF